MRKYLLALPLAAAFALGATGPALAVDEANVSKGATIPGPGLAVHGHDVVAYFTDGAPALGTAEFAHVFDGATYRFASQANLDAFKADPAKYAPAYGASAPTVSRSARSSTATRGSGRSSTAGSSSTSTATFRPSGSRTFPATSPTPTRTGPRSALSPWPTFKRNR
jgi:YHS domain-containing protein